MYVAARVRWELGCLPNLILSAFVPVGMISSCSSTIIFHEIRNLQLRSRRFLVLMCISVKKKSTENMTKMKTFCLGRCNQTEQQLAAEKQKLNSVKQRLTTTTTTKSTDVQRQQLQHDVETQQRYLEDLEFQLLEVSADVEDCLRQRRLNSQNIIARPLASQCALYQCCVHLLYLSSVSSSFLFLSRRTNSNRNINVFVQNRLCFVGRACYVHIRNMAAEQIKVAIA